MTIPPWPAADRLCSEDDLLWIDLTLVYRLSNQTHDTHKER